MEINGVKKGKKKFLKALKKAGNVYKCVIVIDDNLPF